MVDLKICTFFTLFRNHRIRKEWHIVNKYFYILHGLIDIFSYLEQKKNTLCYT